jgi:hypothetical protein
MEKERQVSLVGGRFDGMSVSIDPKAREVWAYMNMYNQPRAVIAGGMRRSESMVTYRVIEGSDVAQHIEN